MKKVITEPIKNLNDTLWWRKKAVLYWIRKSHQLLSHQGVHLPDEEWDNLVILDACRFDMFDEKWERNGKLSKRISPASATPGFLRSNFKDGDFSDTVYVTANPQVNIHLDNEFFKVINVWEDHWDHNLNTVLPDVMADKTITAYEEYPNKRLISHFIQPHYPFIGEIGREKLNSHSGMERSKRLADGVKGSRDQKSIWNQLYEGTVSTDLVWEAYKENLEIMIPEVERVIESFQEYTVITSDHGNALGERGWPFPVKIYGHPSKVRIPALIEVPWFITNTESRKRIISGDSNTMDENHQEMLSDRLADLGYK